MKASLEFDLKEEEQAFKDAINGTNWRRVVDDMDNYLREHVKYKDHDADVHEIYENLREQLGLYICDYELL